MRLERRSGVPIPALRKAAGSFPERWNVAMNKRQQKKAVKKLFQKIKKLNEEIIKQSYGKNGSLFIQATEVGAWGGVLGISSDVQS